MLPAPAFASMAPGMSEQVRAVLSTLAAAALLTAGGCSTVQSVKNTFLGGAPAAGADARLGGFVGAVSADEPRAALAAREVLATGGNAADAAVALAYTLMVTLPSRAGLGGGGACLAYKPDRNGPGRGAPEAVLFTPVAPRNLAGPVDRPAAVPTTPRGMFVLHARYGKKPFEGLVAPAEELARFGTPASRALIRDLAVVAGPLSADPNARAVFIPGGVPLREGADLRQPDLGATLSQLRTAGVGDMYQGALARKIADASQVAGGGLTVEDLRAALPSTSAPIIVRAGRDNVAFLPPPADGGLGAAAAFEVLQRAPGDTNAAGAVALATVGRWRAGGATVEQLLAQPVSGGAGLSGLPASTSFVVLDRDGDAVACALTMGNLFGTGRIAPGTGMLLAASPGAAPRPLLAAGIVFNTNVHAFRAAVGASGQEGASLAAADAIANTLRTNKPMPVPVPEPGRANVIACSRYLPDSEETCGWATDPRGAGLAVGSSE